MSRRCLCRDVIICSASAVRRTNPNKVVCIADGSTERTPEKLPKPVNLNSSGIQKPWVAAGIPKKPKPQTLNPEPERSQLV